MRSIASVAVAILIMTGMVAATDRGTCAQPSSVDPEETLRAVEIAFAKTMADRSHADFVSFLADDVVFLSGDVAFRGKQAVVEAWRPFYESGSAPFSWTPEIAIVLETGGLGLTSGPVYDPDGNQIGTFNSIWRLEPDGKWRIVFDRGCESSSE